MAKVSGVVLIVVRGPVAATLQGRVSEWLSGTQSSVSCDLSKGSTNSRPFLEVLDEMVQLMGQNKKPSAEPGDDLMRGTLCRDADSRFMSAESWVFLVYDLVIIHLPPRQRLSWLHTRSARTLIHNFSIAMKTRKLSRVERMWQVSFFFSSLNFL